MIKPSACPLDCPDRCSLDVDVEGGRVQAIRPSDRYAWTDGYICKKVADFPARVHGSGRVARPAVRVGPKGPGARFVDVSWEEALERIVTRMTAAIAAHGGETVLPVWYGGSNGLLTGNGMDRRFWHRLGASALSRTICAANTSAAATALYGAFPASDVAEVEHSELVVLWGVNPSASGIHLVPPVKALQKRGGKLIVVDPRRTPLAAGADLHLPVLPGTDVALGLAVFREAFRNGHADLNFLAQHADGVGELMEAAERWDLDRAADVCGVPARDIARFVELYAGASPAMVRCGWGLERNRNGTDGVRVALAMPAVFGKFGVRGGGYALSTSGGYRMDSRRWQGVAPPAVRTVNLSQLARSLSDEPGAPITFVWVYNCNPLATVPDQRALAAAMGSEGLFTVVHEQVWTDSCDYADVVLPATTFLEHEELSRSYSGYVLHWAEAAIPPVGEARSNHVVFAELARRMGFDEPAFRATPAELAEEIAAASPVPFARLQAEHSVALPSPVPFVDTFPAQRVQLAPAPRYRPPPADAERPLILVSPASPRAVTSTGFEDLPAGTAEVDLSPEDAAARGVSTGDVVRVWSSLGEVVLLARVRPEVRTGVCVIAKGLWRRSTRNGWTSTALCPAHVDELGAGACYNDARVEVERVA